MKKKTRLLRVTLAVISLLLAATMLSSCGLVNLLLPVFLPSDSFSDFNDLKYERPDFDKIEKTFQEVKEMLQDGKGAYRIRIKLSKAYTLYNDAYTQYNLLQIRYYNDTSDTEASEELAYCSEKFSSLDVLLRDVNIAIVDGGYDKDFFPNWTEKDYDYLEFQKKVYDEEYIALQEERTRLENEYVAITTDTTVSYNGKKLTVNQVAALYGEGKIDSKTYNALIKKYYQNLNKAAAPIYFQLVQIDRKCLEKDDSITNIDYYYRYVYSREYTAEEVKEVHNFVKKYIVPLYSKLAESLDPDLLQNALYSLNDPIGAYDKIFERYATEISSVMKNAYRDMKRYHLSSIGNEAGKQNAGFTTYLPSYDVPYLFLYTQGSLDDVSSFVHEFGHFFSFYRNGFESDSIIDVSEIQSQANEWLFAPYYNLDEAEKEQFLAYRLLQTLSSILEGCAFDEFQQMVYNGQFALQDEANQAFAKIAKEYNLIYDPDLAPYIWTAVHHNFSAPFYYISYAMSAIPALEIYALSRDSRSEAIRTYLDITDETGYRPFLKCLADNKLASPFEKEAYTCIEELVNDVIRGLQSKSAMTQSDRNLFLPDRLAPAA